MELAEIIGGLTKEYEVEFRFNPIFKEYTASVSKQEQVTIRILKYNTGDELDGKEFISFNYWDKKQSRGYGHPIKDQSDLIKHMDKHFTKKSEEQLTMF